MIEFKYESYEDVKVEMNLLNDSTLLDLEVTLARFLRACGYNFDGDVKIGYDNEDLNDRESYYNDTCVDIK